MWQNNINVEDGHDKSGVREWRELVQDRAKRREIAMAPKILRGGPEEEEDW